MRVPLRIKGGWKEHRQKVNKDNPRCSECGARLWIGPGDTVYCNEEHRKEKAIR